MNDCESSADIWRGRSEHEGRRKRLSDSSPLCLDSLARWSQTQSNEVTFVFTQMLFNHKRIRLIYVTDIRNRKITGFEIPQTRVY